MALNPSSRLGPYEVIALLGAGGSDEARFLEVRLKREENRVEEALREAIALAEALGGSKER